ncbi:hypothetical protein Goarm_006375 [Gossypium armourianum]|uniref:Reverse transcriptase zinc-binding domain-containing protein n=1 Tax=Gossypium armourianum TaxID=34283 RepID=A0A7J9JHT0_9ROSI|nr:hypothetical protein [Gossypium armourianum]
MVWFHNHYGYFTSKIAYSWLLLLQIHFGPHIAYWRIIWKLKRLPKIRVFVWRVGHEILPTINKITSIRHGFQKFCPRCGASDETLIHALKECPNARAILTIRGLGNKLLMKDWNNRNNLIFRAKRTTLGTGYRVVMRDEDGFVIGSGEGFKDE